MKDNGETLALACSALQHLGHVEKNMEKALCVLNAIPDGEHAELLEVVDDYVRTGLCKYLASADVALTAVIGKIKAIDNEQCN